MFKKDFRYYFDLYYVLAQKEFKVKYKASIIGYFWSVISPLIQGLVFFLAFGIFMRFPQKNYLLFLLSALYPWQWISNSLSHAPKVFLSNPALVKKIYFPRFFMPTTNVFQEMIHLLFALPVYFLFVLLYGLPLSPALIVYIPLMLLVTYITVASLSVVFAYVNVYVRDLENIIPLGLQMLFFLTPVIYPVTAVPEKIRLILYCNPFFSLIMTWRSVLLEGIMPWDSLGIALLVALISFVFGAYTHKHLSWKLAELL